jgi:hypothetical protein
MPGKLSRRELVKAGAGASLAAAALAHSMPMGTAQNANPAPQQPGVDMSR